MKDEMDSNKESALVVHGARLPAETVDFDSLLKSIDHMEWRDKMWMPFKIVDYFSVCEHPSVEHITQSLQFLERIDGQNENIRTLQGYQAIYTHPQAPLETKKNILERYAVLAKADKMDLITLAKEMKNYFKLSEEPKEVWPLIAKVAASFAQSKWPENRGDASHFLYSILFKNKELSPLEKVPFKEAFKVFAEDAEEADESAQKAAYESIQKSVRRDLERYEQYHPQAEGLDDGNGFIPKPPFS